MDGCVGFGIEMSDGVAWLLLLVVALVEQLQEKLQVKMQFKLVLGMKWSCS